MSYTLQAAPPEHREWLEKRIHRHLDPEDFRGVEAVRADGSIAAMAGFEFWTDTSVGIHVAVDSPVAVRHAPEVLRYAFEQCGRRAVWTMVAEGGASERLARRLGFVETGRIIRGLDRHHDLVLLTLHKR